MFIFFSITKEINLKTVETDELHILKFRFRQFFDIFIIFKHEVAKVCLKHQCERIESRNWGFVIPEVNDGLKFVNCREKHSGNCIL